MQNHCNRLVNSPQRVDKNNFWWQKFIFMNCTMHREHKLLTLVYYLCLCVWCCIYESKPSVSLTSDYTFALKCHKLDYTRCLSTNRHFDWASLTAGPKQAEQKKEWSKLLVPEQVPDMCWVHLIPQCPYVHNFVPWDSRNLIQL